MKACVKNWNAGKVKYTVLAGLFLAVLAVFGGCANTIVPDQVAAIEAAIEKTAQDTEAFYYFEYDDLTPQVEAALEQLEKRQEEYQYTIEVWKADVKKIPEEKLVSPEIAYTLDTDPDAYQADYSMELKGIIEDYIISDELEDLAKTELTVKLKLAEKVWEAELLSADITKLCNTYETEITEKADSMALETEGYQTLRFASDARNEIGTVFSGTLYEDAWTLQSVDKKGEWYTLAVEYPDLTDQLNKAAEQGYTFYADSGKRFNKLSEGEATTKIKELLAASEEAAPVKSITLEMEYAAGVSEGLRVIHEDLDALCTEKAAALTEKVNQELVHQPQEKPGTKVLSGNNNGQTITVKTSADLYDLHITFYELSGTDLSEAGTKRLSAYVNAGDSLNVYLPAGNYKLVQGYGESWYGDELAFGPGGTYTESDILLQIEYGYEYTLTLYGVEGGNLPTSNIPFPYAV